PKALRKVFPPIVTGVTVFLIGAALVGTGFKYWGGGAFCGDNYMNDIPCSVLEIEARSALSLPELLLMRCRSLALVGNGDVVLPFGSAVYVGLGFSVFAMLV
ncbi:unnamed protein product, partial [Hapterophycus canaliculatus]